MKTETALKIFIKFLHVLNLAPKNDVNISKFHRTKTVFFLIVSVCLSCESFYARYFYLPHSELRHSFNVNIQNLIDFIGDVNMALVFPIYLKNATWQRLYKNIDFFSSQDSTVRRLILAYFAIKPFLIYLMFTNYKDFRQVTSSGPKTIILILLPHYVYYYYKITLTTLILALLLTARSKLILTRGSLKVNILNLKTSKNTFINIQEATKQINQLFGYQFLLIFAEWGVTLIQVCMVFVSFLNPNRTEAKSLESLAPMIFGIIIASFGPCAIAFTCDMVTSETEKLLTTCYELQEKFDHRSYEYQELQSFAYYISTNRIRFTAAEFFEIQRSTLLSVVATSTTYFVALVQFY